MRWCRLDQLGAVALIALLTIMLGLSVVYLTRPIAFGFDIDLVEGIAHRSLLALTGTEGPNEGC